MPRHPSARLRARRPRTVRSGRRTRASSRMASRLPKAMPAMNADSTSALDHAPLPSTSAQDRNHRFSKISADAPDSDAMT